MKLLDWLQLVSAVFLLITMIGLILATHFLAFSLGTLYRSLELCQ